MRVTVCIGSSCHLKGSQQVVEKLKNLIKLHNLEDKIILAGAICMGNCQNGVNVTVDDKPYSITPDTTEEFFNKTLIPQLTLI